jgi:hypothetical protein
MERLAAFLGHLDLEGLKEESTNQDLEVKLAGN